jgi:cytochrome P450
MMPGDKVLMSTFLANRDPEEFPDPEQVILVRKPRHVGFGFGVHTCIGMHLAKREMRLQSRNSSPPFRNSGSSPVRKSKAISVVWFHQSSCR